MTLNIFIPGKCPGFNDTYKVGKGRGGKCRMYIAPKVKEWINKASLIVGAAAAEQEWGFKECLYEFELRFSNQKQDVDAPLKLLIDMVTRKLGFDDKYIKKATIDRLSKEESDMIGIWITLKPIT